MLRFEKIRQTIFINISFMLLTGLLFTACDESKPSLDAEGKTKAGAKFKFIARGDKNARKVKEGNLLTFHLVITNHKDSVIKDTYKEATGAIKQLPNQEPYIPKYFKEIFGMMAEGDSVKVWIKVDSLLQKGQQFPPFLKQGTDLAHTFKLVKVQTQEEIKKENDELSKKYKKQNEDELKKYMEDKKLKAEKTASGLYYIIEKQGNNKKPKNSEDVQVHYTGYTLEGNKFDSSVDRGQPFQFALGKGQVIPGWDEGIALLSEGAKAKLLIPSHLAYGAQGAGNVIKPYACLVFDVELVKIGGAPAQPKDEQKKPQ